MRLRSSPVFIAAVAAAASPICITAAALDAAFASPADEFVSCSDDSRALTWDWDENDKNIAAYADWFQWATFALDRMESVRRWHDGSPFMDFTKINDGGPQDFEIDFKDLGNILLGNNQCDGGNGNNVQVNGNLAAIGINPDNSLQVQNHIKRITTHETGHQIGLEHSQNVLPVWASGDVAMSTCLASTTFYALTADDRANLAYVHRNGDTIYHGTNDPHILFANAGFDYEPAGDAWQEYDGGITVSGGPYARLNTGGMQSPGRARFKPNDNLDLLWQSEIIVDGDDDPTYEAIYGVNGSPAESYPVTLRVQVQYRTIDIGGTDNCTGADPADYPDGLAGREMNSWLSGQYSPWTALPITEHTIQPGGQGWSAEIYGTTFRPPDNAATDAVLIQLSFSEEIVGKGAPYTEIFIDSASAIARDPGVD